MTEIQAGKDKKKKRKETKTLIKQPHLSSEQSSCETYGLPSTEVRITSKPIVWWQLVAEETTERNTINTRLIRFSPANWDTAGHFVSTTEGFTTTWARDRIFTAGPCLLLWQLCFDVCRGRKVKGWYVVLYYISSGCCKISWKGNFWCLVLKYVHSNGFYSNFTHTLTFDVVFFFFFDGIGYLT